MKSKLLNQGPERTYAVVLDPGDEVVRALQEFAAQHALTASRVTAIGYLRRTHDPRFGLALIDLGA
jgi:uncharacterized protein